MNYFLILAMVVMATTYAMVTATHRTPTITNNDDGEDDPDYDDDNYGVSQILVQLIDKVLHLYYLFSLDVLQFFYRC